MRAARCFQKSCGGVLKVSGQALEVMSAYALGEHGQHEAGGVLLGRHIIDSADVVVDRVTVPLPGDTREPYRFVRDAPRHQEVVDRVWRESQGRCNYLGRWHTHPQPAPHPSVDDERDWRTALVTEEFDSPTLFFVVVGTEGIVAWEGRKDASVLEALSRAQEEPVPSVVES